MKIAREISQDKANREKRQTKKERRNTPIVFLSRARAFVNAARQAAASATEFKGACAKQDEPCKALQIERNQKRNHRQNANGPQKSASNKSHDIAWRATSKFRGKSSDKRAEAPTRKNTKQPRRSYSIQKAKQLCRPNKTCQKNKAIPRSAGSDERRLQSGRRRGSRRKKKRKRKATKTYSDIEIIAEKPARKRERKARPTHRKKKGTLNTKRKQGSFLSSNADKDFSGCTGRRQLNRTPCYISNKMHEKL